MKFMLKSLSAITLNLLAATALAAPAYLTTHNNTDLESKAYIAGIVPSPYGTPAHDTHKIYWTTVRMICHPYKTNEKCTALVKVGTDTNNPIDIGYVTLDLATGDINPKQLSNNGYTITVNGPGEATISKD